VLRFFGIGITAFRIAGGIVLLVIGLSMLNGTGSSAHTGTKGEQEHLSQTPDVAFYPMAFPVIAGPGTITTLVILTGQAKGAAGYASIAAALLAVLAGLGVVLFLAGNIGHYLSQTLRSVMTRLMGMILAAIAVQMVIVGLKAAFPVLAGS
jgi:membrane protein, marC family